MSEPLSDPVPPSLQVRAVRRLALMGGESTGKTTLARALAAALDTEWVAEYGRELWEALRRTLTVDELVAVAERQVALETAAEARCQARGRDWLLCDTTPLTTLQYCLHDHGDAPERLRELARRHYDLVLLCAPDFDFVQDGCRRDDSFRLDQQAWTVERLTELRLNTLHVAGPVDARLATVRRALDWLDVKDRPEFGLLAPSDQDSPVE